MIKREFICDHCGKKINPVNDYTDIEINDFDFIKTVDLCKECFDQLCDMIRKFIHEN